MNEDRDPQGRKNRENASVRSDNWSDWMRAIVPEKKQYADNTRAYTKRNDGHYGYYCNRVNENLKYRKCGIYEWKAVPNKPTGNHYEVYIGSTHRKSTGALRARVMEYCKDGSHLPKLFNNALKKGYELYVRVKGTECDRKIAEQAENDMLAEYNYAWNTRNNLPLRGDAVPP